jgi:hypothetical protein
LHGLERQIHEAIGVVLEAWRAQLGAARFDALWETSQALTGETAPLPPMHPPATHARRRY